MKRTPKVLVIACLAVLLTGAMLATLTLVASANAGERLGELLSSVPALAELSLIVGTDKGERIEGTDHAEKIPGLGGSDEILDRMGADLVHGGKGKDNLLGYGGILPWIASTVKGATTSCSPVIVPRSKTSWSVDRAPTPYTPTRKTWSPGTASG